METGTTPGYGGCEYLYGGKAERNGAFSGFVGAFLSGWHRGRKGADEGGCPKRNADSTGDGVRGLQSL